MNNTAIVAVLRPQIIMYSPYESKYPIRENNLIMVKNMIIQQESYYGQKNPIRKRRKIGKYNLMIVKIMV